MISRFARSGALMIAALFLVASPSFTRAQQAAAVVNGEPITALDVAQRARLMHLVTHKTATQQQALEELIDEKLKLQAARRYKLDISEADVENAYATMARRVGTAPKQFDTALSQAGITVQAFKTKIKADIAWQQIVRGKFRESLQIRERDVLTALQSRNKDDQALIGYEYTLRPLLLIVPRGAPAPAVEARRREAEGLRAQFRGCAEGIRLARGLRDIAIRDQIIRTTADFTAQLREILDNTQVGQLTPPEVTSQGIALYAVCAKKQTVGALPGRREVQDEMLQQRFESQGKLYLKELRRSAMIEYR
jgi:peptidyl-prolyl cis-trans isomerase SurA